VGKPSWAHRSTQHFIPSGSINKYWQYTLGKKGVRIISVGGITLCVIPYDKMISRDLLTYMHYTNLYFTYFSLLLQLLHFNTRPTQSPVCNGIYWQLCFGPYDALCYQSVFVLVSTFCIVYFMIRYSAIRLQSRNLECINYSVYMMFVILLSAWKLFEFL